MTARTETVEREDDGTEAAMSSASPTAPKAK